MRLKNREATLTELPGTEYCTMYARILLNRIIRCMGLQYNSSYIIVGNDCAGSLEILEL